MTALRLYDFQLQTWKTWVTNDGGIAYPAWTGDSRYVQYAGGGIVNPRIFRVKLGESKSEMLFSLKNLYPYNAALGGWSSNAPDDSVMLARDTGSTEIYALDVDLP